VLVVHIQIAALMERCKRNEEDAAEKGRTVDVLRRKLALVGRPGSASSSTSIPAGIVPGGGANAAVTGQLSLGQQPHQLRLGSSAFPAGSVSGSLLYSSHADDVLGYGATLGSPTAVARASAVRGSWGSPTSMHPLSKLQ